MFKPNANSQTWLYNSPIVDNDDEEEKEEEEEEEMEMSDDNENYVSKQRSLHEFPDSSETFLKLLDSPKNDGRTRYDPMYVPDFIKASIDPRIFKGLQQPQMREKWALSKAGISLMPFLPMPVYFSPCLLMLRAISVKQFKEKQQKEDAEMEVWFPKFTHFQQNIFQIVQVRLACHYQIFPMDMDEFADAQENLEWQSIALESRVFEQLDALYEEFVAKKKNEKEALTLFLSILEKYTLDYIRTQETFIWRCLLKKYNIPWEAILTPSPIDNNKQQKEWSKCMDKEEYLVALVDYFATKNMSWNARLRQNNKDYKFQQFFNIEELPNRLPNAPEDQIFNGYITRETAWEYFRHLDTHNILKK